MLQGHWHSFVFPPTEWQPEPEHQKGDSLYNFPHAATVVNSVGIDIVSGGGDDLQDYSWPHVGEKHSEVCPLSSGMTFRDVIEQLTKLDDILTMHLYGEGVLASYPDLHVHDETRLHSTASVDDICGAEPLRDPIDVDVSPEIIYLTNVQQRAWAYKI